MAIRKLHNYELIKYMVYSICPSLDKIHQVILIISLILTLKRLNFRLHSKNHFSLYPYYNAHLSNFSYSQCKSPCKSINSMVQLRKGICYLLIFTRNLWYNEITMAFMTFANYYNTFRFYHLNLFSFNYSEI